MESATSALLRSSFCLAVVLPLVRFDGVFSEGRFMAGHYYYRSLDALLATDSKQLVSQPLTFSQNSSETLGDAFQDERIWFNHCICVDDYDVRP